MHTIIQKKKQPSVINVTCNWETKMTTDGKNKEWSSASKQVNTGH